MQFHDQTPHNPLNMQFPLTSLATRTKSNLKIKKMFFVEILDQDKKNSCHENLFHAHLIPIYFMRTASKLTIETSNSLIQCCFT